MAVNQISIRKNLLKIYSENKISKIDDQVILQVFFPNDAIDASNLLTLKSQLIEIDIYLRTKDMLNRFKQRIEKNVLSKALDEKTEVIYSLNVVLETAISLASDNTIDEMMYDQRMTLLDDLIKEIFITGKRWSDPLVKHYNFVFPFLKDWYSFFLSYTNKSSEIVNRTYHIFLKKENIEKDTNQVARFVIDRLMLEGISDGFIDEREIDYGNVLKTKIDSALTKSLTFVQIVSKETFTRVGKNWCHYEYECYKKYFEDSFIPQNLAYAQVFSENMFFLIMGEQLDAVKPVMLYEEFEDWYDTINEQRYLKFYTRDHSISSFTDVINGLGIAIIGAKQKLIRNIPN